MKMRNFVGMLLVLIIALASHKTEGAEYVVGDGTGWQNNLGNTTFYESWASSRNFTTGDILTFNFRTGAHDVATVTQDAYNNCNTANPLSITTTGPANITLNSTGMHYYICTFSGHCSRGQKLAISVVASNITNTPTPPPTQIASPPGTSASPPPPPPPSNSSSSIVVANVGLMFMSIAIGYFL